MDNDLTPLGELFEAVRQAMRPKLSQNAAAKAAGTSSTTYRRIISGVSRFGGQDVPFDGSADTVASIARALGVTPEQLEEVGRTDAADELRMVGRAEAVEEALPIRPAKSGRLDMAVPTDDELRASGLAPETIEALLDMRRHVERLVAKRDEDAIRRANRVLRALDEGQDAG